MGDRVELVDVQGLVHVRGGQEKADLYLRLRALGVSAEGPLRRSGRSGRLALGESRPCSRGAEKGQTTRAAEIGRTEVVYVLSDPELTLQRYAENSPVAFEA